MIVKSKRSDNHLTNLRQIFDILRQFQLKLNASKCAFSVSSGKFLGSLVTRRGIEANPDQVTAIQELQSPTSAKQVQRLTGMAAVLNRFITRASDKCRPFFQLLRKCSKFQWTPDCDQALQQLKRYLFSPPLLTTPTRGEVLYLYLAVSEHTVSSVFIKKENGQHRPIYYTSKILLDAETQYLQLEKLTLALVSASRKLSHYFQTFTIVVVTEHPLKALFRKADFSGRISKWATSSWNSPLGVRHRPCSIPIWGGNKDTEAVIETEQEQSWKKFLDSAWKVFVDGSSTSKRVGAGIVFQSPEGFVIEQALTLGFKTSNNEAEYEALIVGLNSAKFLEAWRIVVFSDSQLVTSQLSGDYQARDDRMAAYLSHAKRLLSELERAEVQQISRESNSYADALANLASIVEASNRRTVEVETLQEPSIELQRPRQLMCVDLSPSSMDPIIAYLKDNQLPEDRMETQKIRLKATRFWLSPDDRLYRKSFTGPHLQCVHQAKSTICSTKFMKGSTAITLEVDRSLTEQSAKSTGGHICRRTPSSTPEDAKNARSSPTRSISQHRT
ncbi:hypothetical protein MRB53_033322 [Persea americana]|uniref:Uncharacterized protein n=1 Tax=Persea americana TaxID=3435 RepID=A0ACC2KUC4_PERAE|nr:hypothetical protein MRB53_033322 [Persea americana]